MATATPSAPGASSPKPSSKFVEYDRFIEQQLDKTRGQVRLVDIASAVLLLLTGTLVYFLVVALIDHWVMRTGLGFWGRLFFFVVYLLGALAFVIREIVPLLVRRINPVYAAATIEQSKPTLKNSLVNLLLFRTSTKNAPVALIEAMEEQAATTLSHLPTDSVVDQSRLIKIGYIGLAALALCAIYKVASPKDPFATVRRVIMPWADISAPSRVSIVDVQPGNVKAFRGEPVVVSAEVHGLAGTPVTLYYSTADGQAVDQAVEMRVPASDYRYSASIPASKDGLQQPLTYRIEADDARTKTYSVDVQAAPTIVVDSVGYHYPAYTKLLEKSVKNQGDIRGIEGTQITIEALANHEIRDAHIDFNCDGRDDLAMTVEGTRAKATFTLALEKDRKSPQYASYQLRFTNLDGFANKQPTQYAIEVTPDLPPEVQIVRPKAERAQLPVGKMALIQVQASDPDFALRRVNLHANLGKKALFNQALLDEELAGQYIGKHRLDAGKLRLKAGDVVEYWATVEDNKTPGANKAETAHQFIAIVDPATAGDQGGDPSAHDDSDNQQEQNSDRHPDKNDAAPMRADQNRTPQDQQNPEDLQNAEQNPEQPSDDANPKPNQKRQPGEENRADEGADKSQEKGDKGDREKPDNANADANDQKPSERVNEDGKPGDEANQPDQPGANGNDQAGDQNRNDRKLDNQKGADQNDAGKKGADQKPADQPNANGNQQPGNQRAGNQQPNGQGKPQAGDQNVGKQKGANDQAGNQAQQNPAAKGEQQQNKPVAKDGAADGDAIDKILQHRDQQKKQRPAGADKVDNGKADNRKAEQNGGDNRQKPNDQPDKKPAGQGNPNEAPNQQRDAGNKAPQREQNDKQSGNGKNQAVQPGDNKPSEQQRQGPGENPRAAGNQQKNSGDEQAQPMNGQANGQREKTDTPQGAQASQKRKADSGEKQPGEKRPAEAGNPQNGDKQAGEKQDGQSQDGKQPANQQPGDNKQPGAQKEASRQKPNGEPNQQPEGANQQQQPGEQNKPGEGSRAKPEQQTKQQPPSEQRPSNPMASPDQQKGQAGGAKSSQNDRGSPLPQDKNRERNKSTNTLKQKPDEGNQEEPQSPSISKDQSDSESDEDGSESGGGGKGGGQKGNGAGTGDAGKNTAADQGSGKADQHGRGETSGRAGTDQQSDKQTGQAGSEKGNGSAQQSGQDGSQGGDQAGNTNRQGKQPGDAAQNGSSPGGGNGSPSGGAANNNTTAMPAQKGETVPGGADEANLEYARKATDLAIEHLRDQMKNDHPDQELLDKLGWSKDDLRQFLDRWDKMQQAAKTPGEKGEQAKRELDETLRSLGVRPRSADVRSNDARNDQSRGLKESRRTSPPAEYAEQLKAYTRAAAKGRSN